MESENAAHLAAAPAARVDLDVRPAGDETLVHDPASGQVHVLNAMAARILTACDGRTPLARIVDDLVAATGAERERVAADVARICAEFREKRLVS